MATERETSSLDTGRAAASAAREHQRRKQARERRVRERHPWLGGLILALRDAPHNETAFDHGARGERAVAESLARRTADSPVIILHDRLMPSRRGNIGRQRSTVHR